MLLGGGDKLYNAYLVPVCFGGCSNVGSWTAGDLAQSYVDIPIPGAKGLQGNLFDPAPYSAAANSPSAPGDALANGTTSDALESAVLFPLLKGADGSSRAVNSWSYQLVGGADLLGSVDPMRTLPGATGNVIVEGTDNYTFEGSKLDSSAEFGDVLLFNVGNQYLTANQWYQAFIDANPSLNANSYTFIDFGSSPSGVYNFLLDQIPAFFADHSDQYQLIDGKKSYEGVTTTLYLASQFMADVFAANFSSLKDDYSPPKARVIAKPTTAMARSLVRTGTGNIDVAAAGDIDLTNGPIVYLNIYGKPASPQNGGLQVGGTAIYTAGHAVDPEAFSFVDALTGTNGRN